MTIILVLILHFLVLRSPSLLFSSSYNFGITSSPNLKYINSFRNTNRCQSILFLARYGPKDDIFTNNDELSQEEWEKLDKEKAEKRKNEFNLLLKNIVNAKSAEDLPSLMTTNLDFLLSMRGFEGVNLLQEALKEAESSDDEDYKNSVASACDYIVEFTSEFVEQTRQMDDNNKKLLGKFIKIMASKSTTSDNKTTDREKERKLDEMISKEEQNFTPGFLRHMERECSRIESAPKVTPESAKLAQTLKIIQLRIIEELGKDLGEGAVVLNQLIGFEVREERLAVLEAGLVVRGVEFARSLYGLTKEALDGFNEIPDEIGVDPELKKRVEEISHATNLFIESR